MIPSRVARLARAGTMLLSLCAVGAQAAALEVVTSFSILADFVKQVGGDRVRVTALVAAGTDAHNFEPRPSDAKRVRGAQLVVSNGLGFDPWLERLAHTAGYGGPLLVASKGVEPITAHGDHAHERGHGEATADAADPHAWQDVANARRYVENIAGALEQIDRDGADTYRANTARYLAELVALERDIRAGLERIPPQRRRVVSGHDAFGYFTHAYGVRFLAPAGISNESEASAFGVARLIRQLRKEKAHTVFVENIGDPRLIERIRTESGARLGGTLYADSLSPADGPASTYVMMMRHNLTMLLAAFGAADAPQ